VDSYLAGYVVPYNAENQTTGTESATNQTVVTSTKTVLWTDVAEAAASTLDGSTQPSTFQSAAVAGLPKQINGSSTTECPTFIAGFTSSSALSGPEFSLATLGPTDRISHANRAEKQLEITYRFIAVAILSGLVTGLAFGML
jgi:hypothetical protein